MKTIKQTASRTAVQKIIYASDMLRKIDCGLCNRSGTEYMKQIEHCKKVISRTKEGRMIKPTKEQKEKFKELIEELKTIFNSDAEEGDNKHEYILEQLTELNFDADA